MRLQASLSNATLEEFLGSELGLIKYEILATSIGKALKTFLAAKGNGD